MQELEANQVRAHLGQQLQRIESAGGKSLRVVSAGPALECDLVLVATGVAPNSRLAEKAGLRLGPEKAIDGDHALLTSCQDIYAAGDCAEAVHVVTKQKVMTVADFIQCDLAYAPPFSPVWDPLLTAANQLFKAL
jgi:NAD(P)H-nitrite reductase large subunit